MSSLDPWQLGPVPLSLISSSSHPHRIASPINIASVSNKGKDKAKKNKRSLVDVDLLGTENIINGCCLIRGPLPI